MLKFGFCRFCIGLLILTLSEAHGGNVPEAPPIIGLKVLDGSWENINNPKITIEIANNDVYMISIELIELEILPGDIPLVGQLNPFFRDMEGELIEPGGAPKRIEIDLPVKYPFALNSVFYKPTAIGLQFKFHPGGGMAWAMASADTQDIEPHAPIYSVMLGGVAGVIVLMVIIVVALRTFPADSRVGSIIRATVDRVSWNHFAFGALITLVSIYLLRAYSNPFKSTLERADFVAADFSAGVAIGLGCFAVAQIILPLMFAGAKLNNDVLKRGLAGG